MKERSCPEHKPMTVFPFRPRDWVTDDSGNVARVRSVYEGIPGEVLFDLVVFDRKGERVGRKSPTMGGPRTFEPACSVVGWHRIKEPDFPLQLMWVSGENGKRRAQWHTGAHLPPANWRKPPSRSRGLGGLFDDKFRRALEAIADGHNDARGLASQTLGRQ